MDSLETQQAVRIIEILTEFTETATHLDAYRYNNRSRFVPRHGLRYWSGSGLGPECIVLSQSVM